MIGTRNRRKRLLVGAGVWGLLLAGVHGSSAGAEELRIGYVNLAKVFDGYQRTKVSDAGLEKKGKQKELELSGRIEELKKMRQGLDLLSDEAREAKAREIEEKSEELDRFRAGTARDLRRERDKMAKEILQDIQQTLEEYAKAKGFSLIFDSRSLFYSQSAYDVSDDLLKLLNDRARPAR